MGRAVIHDPKDPSGALVGFLRHDLLDQVAKGLYACGAFATTKHLGSSHIPSRQVSQCATAFIFELHAHGLLGSRRQARMQADAGLDAGFLVGGNYVIVGFQSPAFPDSLIEIEHALGLGLKLRIAREYPAAMLSGTNGVLIEPAPNRTAANFGYDAALSDFTDQILATIAGKRLAAFFGQFASNGLDLHNQFRGENWAGARTGVDSPS